MGRYYNGDIDGKFWFGTQSSDDADFFGVTGYQPNRLEYEFEEDNLPEVLEGINECKEKLGSYKVKLDKFFKKNNGYNDEMLKEAGIEPALLAWYARLELGIKIRDSIKTNGHCYFEAEC